MAKPTKKSPKGNDPDKVSTDLPVHDASDDDVLHNLLDAQIEIPIQVLRDKHIFIATPCYGGQLGEPYFRSMMRLAILCNKYDINFTVSTLANESLITRGRNTLVSFFMEHPEATHFQYVFWNVLYSHRGPQIKRRRRRGEDFWTLPCTCQKVGHFVHVFVNNETRRPVPIEGELRKAFEALA